MGNLRFARKKLKALRNNKSTPICVVFFVGYKLRPENFVGVWTPKFCPSIPVDIMEGVLGSYNPGEDVVLQRWLFQGIASKHKSLLLRCPRVLRANFFEDMDASLLKLRRARMEQCVPDACGQSGSLGCD